MSSHGSKDGVIGKNRRSRPLKSDISRCSRLFPWLPIVPMDLAWDFRATLTGNFGSSGASSSSYSKWKSSKIAGFSLHAGCYLGQTSTSESHLLTPNCLGTWGALPQGTGWEVVVIDND